MQKKVPPSILVQAIQKIAMSGIYIETEFLENSSGQSNETHYKTIIEAFSTREFDIFLLLARGFTGHKISDELCLSYKTVANYGMQIRSKLKISSVAELAHIALVSEVMKN